MGRVAIALLALSFVFGCGKKKSAASAPLPQAILGEWEVLCRTDRESKTTCLGKEDMGMFKVFRQGGTLTSGSTKGTSMEGTWTLDGNRLTLVFSGGGMRLTEGYRARMSNDRLVLWHVQNEFGVIHGRKGAKFVPAPGPTSDGKPVTQKLGGLRYSIGLPANYRLARNDNNRQQWKPKSANGLWVRLTVSPRARTMVDGKWVTPPCNDRDYGGVSGSSEVIDGVERKTSVGTSICVKGTELVMMCSAEHTRGWLKPEDKAPGLALCKSVKLTP